MPVIKWFQKITKNNKRTTSHMHTQKRFFSLMLIPSYSSGKTRSIRISFSTLYIALFAMVAIACIMGFLHFQSRSFSQVVLEASASLEQTQEAFASLQEITEQEQSQLVEGIVSLLTDINDERTRSQEEMQQQQQDFLETLESIWLYTNDLEMRIRTYETYRQEIMTRLDESSHIPIVSRALNDMQQSQDYLLAPFNGLFEYPVVSPDFASGSMEQTIEPATGQMISLLAHSTSQTLSTDEAARYLVYYITMLELALEAQKELYSQLLENVSVVAPHIRRDRYGPQLLYWSYVRNILPRNTPVMITDVRTGTTFWINSFSHGNHADVFPVTAADTAALLRTRGGQWSWDTRPVWVHIGDRKVAASMNGMPHGGGGNRGNNMNGHICIHFRGSRTHNGSWHHERDHQNSVMEAYRADF